jgi:hypothetical protein
MDVLDRDRRMSVAMRWCGGRLFTPKQSDGNRFRTGARRRRRESRSRSEAATATRAQQTFSGLSWVDRSSWCRRPGRVVWHGERWQTRRNTEGWRARGVGCWAKDRLVQQRRRAWRRPSMWETKSSGSVFVVFISKVPSPVRLSNRHVRTMTRINVGQPRSLAP